MVPALSELTAFRALRGAKRVVERFVLPLVEPVMRFVGEQIVCPLAKLFGQFGGLLLAGLHPFVEDFELLLQTFRRASEEELRLRRTQQK